MSNITKENISHHIQTQLLWRYATKLFDKNRKIPTSDWNILAESLRLSASSFGLQPWRFVVVQSLEILGKLGNAAPLNRIKFETASHVVVFTRLKVITIEYIDNYMKLISETRNLPSIELNEFRNMIVNWVPTMPAEVQANWIARQTYIALGNLLTTAAMLEIDACPMEGIDLLQFDEILGLTGTNYASIACVALGYRSPEDKTQFLKKVRFPSNDLFVYV